MAHADEGNLRQGVSKKNGELEVVKLQHSQQCLRDLPRECAFLRDRSPAAARQLLERVHSAGERQTVSRVRPRLATPQVIEEWPSLSLYNRMERY